MTKRIIYLFPLLVMLLSFGCGGGSSGNTTGVPTKATISFSLISTATLPFRLTGVQINATLPNGLTVATSGKTIASGLEVGSAASGSVTALFPVFGSYSAPNRITLTVADSTSLQQGFGPGEVVRLTCLITAGATFSESERLALENALTFIASGWDPRPSATTNPSSLNVLLKPRIGVTLSN